MRSLNRRAEIVYKLLDGWSNTAIAEKYDLSKMQVSNIGRTISAKDREHYLYRRSKNMAGKEVE